MVLQVNGQLLEWIPSIEDGSLDEFFDENPEIGDSNVQLTNVPHTKMWREEVLFIRQRMQATSDYRENKKVRWIGSHAALTCHIVVMRHIVTGVVSVGHFDNFCCWQFGEESSAHKDGINIMLEEIAALSRGYADGGRVHVSVFGGYQDTRGDAARNSLSILNALHEDERLLELKHFCVGRYNTQAVGKQNNILSTETTAILKGIAVDIKLQRIFPANFEWGNLDDFKLQIADKRRKKDGLTPFDTEEANKTADSTFKPKSLRNKANYENLLKEANVDNASELSAPLPIDVIELKEVVPSHVSKGRKKMNSKEDMDNTLIPGRAFNVLLKHTPINDKTAQSNKRKRKNKVNENKDRRNIET